MTARRGPGRSRLGLVLVFGESINDSTSVAHLLQAANPALVGRTRARPKPTSLTRTARPPAVATWVAKLREAVKAVEATERVAAVVVHRDADGPDPDGTVAAELAGQIAELDGHPVVPVQAIEAWWFLFPDAVEAVRPSAWRGTVPRKKRDVELVDDPKAALMRATGTKAGPEYAEADSPQIAKHVHERALQPLCACRSYARLVATAERIR